MVYHTLGADTKIETYVRVLGDQNQPLKKRFRALFALKHFGGMKSIEGIANCFSDPSALLKHELAYCLGQMLDKAAVPTLIRQLADDNQEPVVRHEAAEALAAIGDQNSAVVLRQFVGHPIPEIAQTCELSLRRLEWLANGGDFGTTCKNHVFTTTDPAPASSLTSDVGSLKATLLNGSESLWERYRAMFKLRDMSTEGSILALVEGLKCNDSALLRHEVAFVLGQIQSPLVVDQLVERLEDCSENAMVRHECAEALGAIGSEKCKVILEKFLLDSERIVRESCEVALDICEYNENESGFQYAECEA